MAELTTGFDCSTCGKHHETLPLSFSVKAPLAATRIAAADIERRLVINADQCVIDGTSFYLRGRMVIPILGRPEPFVWGVWAEVGPKDFIRTQELWKVPGREREAAFRGWLDTELTIYESTVNLEVSVRTQIVGRRPHFQVLSTEHLLGREQRAGITLARVEQIAAALLHSTSPASSQPAPRSV